MNEIEIELNEMKWNWREQRCLITYLDPSRYDLKKSTRVPLDSERPKDSFNLCPTALSQLGAKWHGGGTPHMCVLGWGNSMCGRWLSQTTVPLNLPSFRLSSYPIQSWYSRSLVISGWKDLNPSKTNKTNPLPGYPALFHQLLPCSGTSGCSRLSFMEAEPGLSHCPVCQSTTPACSLPELIPASVTLQYQ